jgi:predicted dehydrogenase
VSAPVRVGLIGCGIIGKRYAQGARAFGSFEIVACSDLEPAAARVLAAEQGIEAVSPDELVAEPGIDVVLNLTPPTAHAPILLEALAAGKHVYTEKPLAASVAEAAAVLTDAERRGLRVGCAPDTFLGSAYQAGQRLIEEGAIGEPLSATALMLLGGPEAWHPNADMFYRAGGGPLLDLAPYPLTAIAALLGPIAAATGFATTPVSERTLAVGPRLGERFAVEVPTLVTAALRLERGPVATLTTTFEATGQYETALVINGTEGSLSLPDPNDFGGDVQLRRGRDERTTVAYESLGARDTRGLGLHEMVEAMAEDRPHRASGQLALHVLEIAGAVLRSAAEGRTVPVGA